MKVRMLVEIAGTINGHPWPERGGIIDVPKQVANDLLINKYAVVDDIETAAVDPVIETASKPAARARKTVDG